MNTNPVNLAVRFILELVMLVVLALWSWHLSESWVRFVATAGFPVIAATLWGVFRIQNDPKPSPVEIPGRLRLLLELTLFGWAVWALNELGDSILGWVMTVVVIMHYVVSYDRTWAMIRNKPYNGFVK